MIVSTNPATGAELARFEPHSASALDTMLSGAVAAQARWRETPIAERTAALTRLAEVLRAGKSRYGRMITEEMGKPVAEAEGEVEKSAWACDFYAAEAAAFLADTPAPSSASESFIAYDPLGIVLAIMPWNFPLWQFFRFAAPAFAAGNGAILKHASNVPQCALAIEEIVSAAGLPAGLFRTALVGSDAVEGLIADDRIAAVTFTGSTEIGAKVAAAAGRAIKKQVLELGGSDPFIVLADADVEAAAATAVKARFVNVGQSCVNAKRFIVEDAVADRFVAAFAEGVRGLKVGDPMQRDTTIGPMARMDLRDTLHEQVRRSVDAGAVVVAGGAPVDVPGCFYAPTLLDRVTPDMAVFREETFGPAAAVIRVRDADHAIRLANDSEYGLGAALWTADVARARALARRIESGAVFINGMVASDPRLPFGGIKRSGYGRELGEAGIREFVNIKTVWIGPAR